MALNNFWKKWTFWTFLVGLPLVLTALAAIFLGRMWLPVALIGFGITSWIWVRKCLTGKWLWFTAVPVAMVVLGLVLTLVGNWEAISSTASRVSDSARSAAATPTPQVIERVVEVECPEKLEKYNSAIYRGEMNCTLEGTDINIVPGQDREVNGVLWGCDICNGKPVGPIARRAVVSPTPPTPPAGSQDVVDNGSSDRPLGCKTDAEVIALFGLDELEVPVFTGENVPWDFCKWNLQSPVEGLPLPAGWELTARRMDRSIAVYYGPLTEKLNVLGGTIRQLDVYNTDATKWANNKCEMLAREEAFGMRRNPAYHTYAGNFTCAGSAPTPTPTPAGQTASCFSSPQAIAEKIGGTAQYWQAPDWEGGAWVYCPKSMQPGCKEKWVELKVPGFGYLDYWNGQKGAADKLTTGAVTVDEASFHCN